MHQAGRAKWNKGVTAAAVGVWHVLAIQIAGKTMRCGRIEENVEILPFLEREGVNS
jgi:hypothetical protein